MAEDTTETLRARVRDVEQALRERIQALREEGPADDKVQDGLWFGFMANDAEALADAFRDLLAALSAESQRADTAEQAQGIIEEEWIRIASQNAADANQREADLRAKLNAAEQEKAELQQQRDGAREALIASSSDEEHRLRLRVKDLEAAVETLRQEREWQPIETAPKDGRIVIGFDPVEETICDDDSFITGVEFMRWLDGAWLDPLTHSRKPSHWMPLPAPPRLDGSGRQEKEYEKNEE